MYPLCALNTSGRRNCRDHGRFAATRCSLGCQQGVGIVCMPLLPLPPSPHRLLVRGTRPPCESLLHLRIVFVLIVIILLRFGRLLRSRPRPSLFCCLSFCSHGWLRGGCSLSRENAQSSLFSAIFRRPLKVVSLFFGSSLPVAKWCSSVSFRGSRKKYEKSMDRQIR